MNISSRGELVLEDVKYVASSAGSKRLRAGDVLFNNTNSPKLVGKTALVRAPGEWAFSNHMTRLSLPDYVDASFLAMQLQALQLDGYFEQICSNHVNQASVSTSRLLAVEVNLPLLDEQRRIVDILEDHLSRIDAAEVELDRGFRRAASLLESARNAALSTATGRVALEELALIGTGSTPSRSRSDYYSDGTVAWLTSGDLQQGGAAVPSRRISEIAVRDSRLKLYPAGTLVVAMYGEGKTRGTVAELGIDSTMNQACAAVQMHGDAIDRAWVKLALVNEYQRMRASAIGGVQPNLNLKIIRSIMIPTAPRDVMVRGLDAVQVADAGVARLSKAVAAARARAASLRRALLTAAFSGRLTGRASDTDRIEELADASHDTR